MKKICFVLALVLMLSSLCVAPVFAENLYVNIGKFTTGPDYTIFNDDGSKRISSEGFDKDKKSSNAKTGLTQTEASVAPQKVSGDVAHYVSGTSKFTYPDTWRSKYAGTNVAFVANSNDNAKNRKHYIISFDLYRTIDKPICLRYGFATGNSTEIHFGNIGTDLANTKRNRVNDTVTNKWQNIVVDTEIKPATAGTANGWITKVYVDGVPQKIKDKNGKEDYTALGDIITSGTVTDTISVFNTTGLTMLFTENTKYDFYFDNFKAVASDNAYVPGAAATIDGADATGAVTYASGTKASAVTATNAASVEIYRANAASTTGYDIISGDAVIANNDIIKLTTANGVYSYYTVKVGGGGVPFAIGNLTAPASSPEKGSSISASLALSGDTADKEVTLILALYRGITLCDIKTATIANGAAVSGDLTVSTTVPSSDGNYTAKAFVWENADSMIQYK